MDTTKKQDDEKIIVPEEQQKKENEVEELTEEADADAVPTTEDAEKLN